MHDFELHVLRIAYFNFCMDFFKRSALETSDTCYHYIATLSRSSLGWCKKIYFISMRQRIYTEVPLKAS